MIPDNDMKELFPKNWSHTLFKEDVEELICSGQAIVIKKTMGVVGDEQWNLDKLRNLIDTKGAHLNEKWRLPEGAQHLLIWQGDYSPSSAPDAIMSFEFEVGEKTRTGKPSYIYLTNHLVWVVPESRNKGLGCHLVAHFFEYLQGCKVYYPFVSQRGVDLVFCSEYLSEGGEVLSEKIISFLNDMREEKSCWSIKSLDVEAGF